MGLREDSDPALGVERSLNIVSLPKTIDNDIYGTDMTFGFRVQWILQRMPLIVFIQQRHPWPCIKTDGA
ncbi:MAG: 6-phosphofructokinase [Coprococcus sp.]